MGRLEEMIRKQDAIRVIDELLKQMTEDGCLTVIGELRVKELKQDIENLPAVQPKPPWIPCSKKLPDYGYEVLISLYDTTEVAHRVAPTHGPGLNGEKDCWIDWDGYGIEPEDVYAWMPLPDPYEGDIPEVL